MARAMAARLKRSMARDGRVMSNATEQDAIGAGAAAVVRWRNGHSCEGAEYGARGVCWRAVVASVSEDSLGESIEDWRGDDDGADCWDSLTGSALPLPSLVGDGSRAECRARLLFERARAKRPALLARRIESLKARGGRGKRGELLDKLHRAAVLLLHGEGIDAAATAAGFKSSGAGRQAVRAGDMLMRAARRLGFRVWFTARDSEHRDKPGPGGHPAPIAAATVAAWSFEPSATLPLQDGRGGKRRVPKIRRLQRSNARARRLALARSAKALRLSRREAKRHKLARSARRADKAQGWFAIFGAAAGASGSRTNGFWRGAVRPRRG